VSERGGGQMSRHRRSNRISIAPAVASRDQATYQSVFAISDVITPRRTIRARTFAFSPHWTPAPSVKNTAQTKTRSPDDWLKFRFRVRVWVKLRVSVQSGTKFVLQSVASVRQSVSLHFIC